MIELRDLTFRFGERLLLDHASVSLPAGHRIGFVGRNGTGKTTLLSLILGQIQPEAGEITMPRRSRIGTVAQRLPDPRLTPREMVLAGDAERARLMAQADDQSNPLAAADAHARLVETGAHAAPAQAARILAGLGFDEAAQARPLAEYSGGWRMRAALAAALFAEPDLLLLDEPTNHLDLEAALWLEGHLARYPHTVLMVSHDRRLLERATDRTLLLEGGKLKLYGGGFSVFERIRREERLTVGREAERVAKAKAHMEAFVERFRYKASKARQAQSRLKALEKLGDPTPLVEAGDVRFDFPQPRPLSPPILALDDVSVGYGGKPVLEHLSLRLEPDDRVALLGANGNGKTTLARLLAGQLAPLSGEVIRPGKLQVGYLAQDEADSLDDRTTAVTHLARLRPRDDPTRLRAHLGRFGLTQGRAETKVGNLSGGERARVLLAMASAAEPHLLIFDEPTNHLDLDSRDALVQALNAFEGAVVLISHDPHLVDLVADRLWLVADGACRPYADDLATYARSLGQVAAEGRRDRSRRKADNQRAKGTPAGASVQALKRQAETAETAVSALNRQKNELAAALADPRHHRDGSTMAQLAQQAAEVSAKLAKAEAQWLALLEQVEARADHTKTLSGRR